MVFQEAVPSQVHVKLRPHVQEFLERLSKTYEVPGAPGVCGVTLPGGWGDLGSRAGTFTLSLPDLHLHHCEAGLCQEAPGGAGPQEEADQVMVLAVPFWRPPV